MQPLLLRSAGVAGLAAAIVAAISSDALFVSSDRAPPEPTVQVAAVQDSAATPPAAAAHDAAPGTVGPATGVFERPQPAVASAELAADALTTPAPATAPVAEPQTAPAEAAPAAAPAILAAVEPAPRTEPAESGTVEPATECPRDWIDVDGSPGTDGPAHCSDAAALFEATSPESEQQALDDAALERASELAALQFVPRVPMPRPDPPPQRPRKSAIKRANWPAGPPPNCGSKHAFWRYVNKVPTWYCK